MARNPWKGLSAYHEPQEGDDYIYKFCGRNNAIKDLVALVESNLYVTMYGRTGIGKTSLLEAGIFPILRERNYVPIVVRFSLMDDFSERFSFAEYIVKNIEQSVDEIEVTFDVKLMNDGNALDYLWKYFATRHFYKDEKEVYPLIILDQFEENFRNDKAETWNLLEQLHSLVNDNKIYPEGYHDETNFRIVISIREDDLFRLEDCIDQCHLMDFKFNRYRLVQPTEIEAFEIVSIPGEKCLPSDELERKEIVNRIIQTVKNGNEGNINTLILSLICSILYDKIVSAKRTCITLEDVMCLGDSPLTDFYVSLNLSEEARKFIENKLIDFDGHRNMVNVGEVKKGLPEWKSLLGANEDGIYNDGKIRILQESNGKVELVHDMLAKAVKVCRDKHRNELDNVICSIITLGTFILLGFQLLELSEKTIGEPVFNLLFRNWDINHLIMTSLFVLNCINIMNLLWLGYGVVKSIKKIYLFAAISLLVAIIITISFMVCAKDESQNIICIITLVLSMLYFIVSFNQNKNYVK